jgi:hypothetical protein
MAPEPEGDSNRWRWVFPASADANSVAVLLHVDPRHDAIVEASLRTNAATGSLSQPHTEDVARHRGAHAPSDRRANYAKERAEDCPEKASNPGPPPAVEMRRAGRVQRDCPETTTSPTSAGGPSTSCVAQNACSSWGD